MTKLRVAVYHNLHSGGAKRVAEEQLRGLASQCTVKLFSLNTADQQFAAQRASDLIEVSLLSYQPVSMLRSPFGRINPIIGLLNIMRLDRLAHQTANLIDQQGFDVVLAHPCQVTQAPLLLRWLRTPSLYYCHELPRSLYEPQIARPYTTRSPRRQLLDKIDPLPSLIRLFLRKLDYHCTRHATRIAVNSRLTLQNVLNAYGREADVCAPCVDVDTFQPIFLDREPFVLSVGALTPAKGFDFIISALATLPSRDRPRLVIISNYQDSAELHYLTALAQSLAVQVEFRVGVTEVDLHTWYARAGCVAYAPIREPFGLVALEAMACAAPIVGVAEGGILETVVNQHSGILTARVPTLFGEAIRQLLENPQKASQLGQTARQYVVKQWTWKHHIERIQSLLAKVST